MVSYVVERKRNGRDTERQTGERRYKRERKEERRRERESALSRKLKTNNKFFYVSGQCPSI